MHLVRGKVMGTGDGDGDEDGEEDGDGGRVGTGDGGTHKEL